jgi:hypothetical protein
MNRTLYLIEHKHNETGISIDLDSFDDRERVVHELSEGYHFGNTFTVSRILEIRPDGTWGDITVEIAREVRDQVMRDPHSEYDWHMAEFIHRNLGVGSIRWPRAA